MDARSIISSIVAYTYTGGIQFLTDNLFDLKALQLLHVTFVIR